MQYDFIIVGAGIAGASAAWSLSAHGKVLIVEAQTPASGASGVAAGLFSPMLALRGRPAWRIHESIEAFYRQLDESEARPLFDDRGVLRPAKDEQQAAYFLESTSRKPDEARWLPPEASQEQHPLVHAPFGSMYVPRGGAIHIATYVNRLITAVQHRGADLLTHARVVDWDDLNEGGAFVVVHHQDGSQHRLEASHVLFCWGKTFSDIPSLAHLNLHHTKGQTIRVTRPKDVPTDSLIPISGNGYIMPSPDHLAIGSSYEHTYASEAPTSEVSQALFQKAQHLVPALHDSKIIDAQVGFRLTVPGIRKPIVGPIPGYSRIFAFSGFGSKGLLLAPLLSYELFEHLHTPSKIPKELRITVKTL